MLSRKNYDKKVLAVFDTIGSYFVDIFYNGHYLRARDMVQAGGKSITDSYRSCVINYMQGIKRRDLYANVVRQLHEYYQRNSGFGSIIFSDFEDKVLAQFIPPEYYRDFTERQKDATLQQIIVKTINEFGEVISSKQVIMRIIDDHMNVSNVTMLQDSIVDIFIIQREDYYASFAQEISKSSGNGKINKEIIHKLKKAYVEEKQRSCGLEVERDRATNIIQQLMRKLQGIESEVAALRARCEALSQKCTAAEQASRAAPNPVEYVNKAYSAPKAADPPQEAVIESADDESDGQETYNAQQAALKSRFENLNDDPWS